VEEEIVARERESAVFQIGAEPKALAARMQAAIIAMAVLDFGAGRRPFLPPSPAKADRAGW
jgi:hypothetical protein